MAEKSAFQLVNKKRSERPPEPGSPAYIALHASKPEPREENLQPTKELVPIEDALGAAYFGTHLPEDVKSLIPPASSIDTIAEIIAKKEGNAALDNLADRLGCGVEVSAKNSYEEKAAAIVAYVEETESKNPDFATVRDTIAAEMRNPTIKSDASNSKNYRELFNQVTRDTLYVASSNELAPYMGHVQTIASNKLDAETKKLSTDAERDVVVECVTNYINDNPENKPDPSQKEERYIAAVISLTYDEVECASCNNEHICKKIKKAHDLVDALEQYNEA